MSQPSSAQPLFFVPQETRLASRTEIPLPSWTKTLQVSRLEKETPRKMYYSMED